MTTEVKKKEFHCPKCERFYFKDSIPKVCDCSFELNKFLKITHHKWENYK